VNVIFFVFTPLKYTLSITCATYLLSFLMKIAQFRFKSTANRAYKLEFRSAQRFLTANRLWARLSE